MSDIALMDKIKEIEELEEKTGWDSLPSLFLLSKDDDGKVVIEVLAVIDAPSFPNIYEAFYRVAMDLPEPKHTPIAVAFCAEGWTPDIPEGANKADIKAFLATYPYKRFADDPNRLEVRAVIALTAEGKRYVVGRIRGKEQLASVAERDSIVQNGRLLGLMETGGKPLQDLMNAWVGMKR